MRTLRDYARETRQPRVSQQFHGNLPPVVLCFSPSKRHGDGRVRRYYRFGTPKHTAVLARRLRLGWARRCKAERAGVAAQRSRSCGERRGVIWPLQSVEPSKATSLYARRAQRSHVPANSASAIAAPRAPQRLDGPEIRGPGRRRPEGDVPAEKRCAASQRR